MSTRESTKPSIEIISERIEIQVSERVIETPEGPDRHKGRKPLDAIFAPKNIALVGATESEGSVGRTLLRNLVGGPFEGNVYPVNPKRASVLGTKAYPSIKDVPVKIDLAVIATKASAVPDVIRQCEEAGVGGVVIISAGFKELGPEGAGLESQIVECIKNSKMRVIGPNCLGVMNPITGLNATFAAATARPGNVAFLSQSGALCTAILDWSLQELVGYSAFVSTGSMLDVGWGDLIEYFGNDPKTKSILIYMESVGDAESFLTAARKTAQEKPIILIKAGRTDAAAKAAASHTGAMTGSDEVFDAALRRVGVLRVHTIADLFYMSETLARQPRPKGPNLAIVTNAGGPGVLATDSLIERGGELAELSDQSLQELNALLPVHWSHANPVDVLGDAGPDRFAKAVEIVAKDESNDGLLVILTPQDMTNPTDTAIMLRPYAKLNKPILAAWMGGTAVAAGNAILNQVGIPTFRFPDAAARTFQYMWQYAYNLRGIYEKPAPTAQSVECRECYPDVASEMIATALKAGKTLMDEVTSKKLLSAYGIPVVNTDVALTADDAAKMAEAIGYPVVLKLYSQIITHKTDVGGVKLNLLHAEDVRQAFEAIKTAIAKHPSKAPFEGVTVQPMIDLRESYEIILGSSIDPQFGPVLLFGSGGQLVEVFKDRSLGLPPLNRNLARRMMEQTKIFKAFKGVRGRKPVNIEELSELLVRFSQLVADHPRIREIDINPLLVSAERIVAVDARVILFPADIPADKLPKPAMKPDPVGG